jgi:ABC-type arginine transport system permease subunit
MYFVIYLTVIANFSFSALTSEVSREANRCIRMNQYTALGAMGMNKKNHNFMPKSLRLKVMVRVLLFMDE